MINSIPDLVITSRAPVRLWREVMPKADQPLADNPQYCHSGLTRIRSWIATVGMASLAMTQQAI